MSNEKRHLNKPDSAPQDGGVFEEDEGSELWFDEDVPQGEVAPPAPKKQNWFARLLARQKQTALEDKRDAEQRRRPQKRQPTSPQRLARGGVQPARSSVQMPSEDGENPHNRAQLLAPVRRKKYRRRMRFLAVVVLLAAAVLAYITGVFGASISALSDLTDNIYIAFTPGGGWPQSFTLDGFSSAKEMAGGFAAVGNSDLTLYSSTGRQLRRVQHSYAQPALAVGSTRMVLYNRGGTQLTVESRTRTLYTYDAGASIRQCDISDNGYVAVLTTDSVLVLDRQQKEVLRWKPESSVSAMAISNNGKTVLVACTHAENGYVGTQLYKLEVRGKQEYPDLIGACPDGLALTVRYLSSGRALVVYDNSVAVYNDSTSSTEALFTYNFGERRLADICAQGNNTVLLFGTQKNAATMQYVLLNNQLREVSRAVVGEYVLDVQADRGAVYALCTDGVRVYDTDGTYEGKQPTTTRPLAMVCAEKNLLFTSGTVTAFTLESENRVDAPPQSIPQEASSAASVQTDATIGTSVQAENTIGTSVQTEETIGASVQTEDTIGASAAA